MRPHCWDAICYAAGTTRNGGSVTLTQSDCRELTAYVIQLTARGMAELPATTAQLRAELAAAKEYGRRMASEMVFQEARADALQARWLRALADQPAATETEDWSQVECTVAPRTAPQGAPRRGATTIMFDGSEVMGTPVRAPQPARSRLHELAARMGEPPASLLAGSPQGAPCPRCGRRPGMDSELCAAEPNRSEVVK